MRPRSESNDTFTKQDFAFWKSAGRVRRIKGTRRVRKSQHSGNSRYWDFLGQKILVPRIMK